MALFPIGLVDVYLVPLASTAMVRSVEPLNAARCRSFIGSIAVLQSAR